MRVLSSMPQPKRRKSLGWLLLLIPVGLASAGFIAMLTFGAIANEFGASDAPGFWGSLGIAVGLSVLFATSSSSSSR